MSLIEHEDRNSGYVAFLVNFFDPVVQLPVEVLPGVVLRRATVDETAVFRPYDDAAHMDRGDHRIICTTISGRTGSVTTKTNEDFRGYVLQFTLRHWAKFTTDLHSVYERLELACSISESCLRPVLICELKSTLEPLFFTHNLHRHTVLRRRALCNFLKEIPKFIANDLAEIRDLTDCIKNLSSEHSFVIEAIERFKQVELISLESDFHTFGLFTIIEYLLTHQPKLGDENDTLVKQLHTKAPLVSDHFDFNISLAKFFSIKNEDKAWDILYDYRSAIAHGRPIDFTRRKKGFLELKDRNQIESYLHLFTRRLLKVALRDPARVLSIKEN